MAREQRCSHCGAPRLTALGLTTSLITTSLPASASGYWTSATRPMETCLANGILALVRGTAAAWEAEAAA